MGLKGPNEIIFAVMFAFLFSVVLFFVGKAVFVSEFKSALLFLDGWFDVESSMSNFVMKLNSIFVRFNMLELRYII